MLHPRAEGPARLLEVRPGVASMVAASAGETGQLLPEGRDHLTHQEFLVGIKKLSLEVDDDSSKCAAVIAGADKCIDCLEFIRAFAWHDIANWQDAMNEARMLKSSSIAIANDRIKALASGPAPSSTSRAEAAPNQVRAWTSAEMGF